MTHHDRDRGARSDDRCWSDEDLGAVGSVDVPPPAGIPFDPEAVVDLAADAGEPVTTVFRG
jgi:hypothetical protein